MEQLLVICQLRCEFITLAYIYSLTKGLSMAVIFRNIFKNLYPLFVVLQFLLMSDGIFLYNFHISCQKSYLFLNLV